nr:hypothetical protein [Candidatus Sigynarchaeota archaeon]
MGAVVPIIILRNDGEQELRKYLYNEYWFTYIVVREDMYNFSENTQLRECLLILEKKKHGMDDAPRLVNYIFIHDIQLENMHAVTGMILDTLERDPQRQNTVIPHATRAFSVLTIPHHQLDANNLFSPVALFSFNHDYYSEWSKLRELHPFKKLGNLRGIKIISKNQPEPAKTKLKFKQTSMLLESYKKDKEDIIIKTDAGRFLEIKQKDPEHALVRIDKANCRPMLRYITKKATMSLASIPEYVISAPVPELPSIQGDWAAWGRFLDSRTANMVIVDRLDFTTEGYHLLAFFSDEPRVIARTTAAIQGVDGTTAKLLVLWFNSSLGVLEWLLTRSPQRFGYCQHHVFTLGEMVVPTAGLVDEERIDSVFGALKDCKFPSLMEQFARLMPRQLVQEFTGVLGKYKLADGTILLDVAGKGFPPRQKLDRFILTILLECMNEEHQERLCMLLHRHEGDSCTKDIPAHGKYLDNDVNNLLENLHSRIARILLTSKRAMGS